MTDLSKVLFWLFENFVFSSFRISCYLFILFLLRVRKVFLLMQTNLEEIEYKRKFVTKKDGFSSLVCDQQLKIREYLVCKELHGH